MADDDLALNQISYSGLHDSERSGAGRLRVAKVPQIKTNQSMSQLLGPKLRKPEALTRVKVLS